MAEKMVLRVFTGKEFRGWSEAGRGVSGSVPLLKQETVPGDQPSALGKGLCRQMLLLA